MPDSAASRPKSNIILSFPRSGTDFFCSALQRDRSISYVREFFNPICNPQYRDVLSRCFGHEQADGFLRILQEHPTEQVDDVVSESWARESWNTTKENFSAIKAEQLRHHFNMICLIRNISHTLPSSRPDYLTCIAGSFYMAGAYRRSFLASELNELRVFISRFTIQDITQICMVAYMVQHYLLLAVCRRFGLPIIRYEDLIIAGRSELPGKLSCLSLFGADVAIVVDALLELRFRDGQETLTKRQDAFHSLRPPKWLRSVRDFLVDLSPDLATDIESYLTPYG